jgi:hypothetical protein
LGDFCLERYAIEAAMTDIVENLILDLVEWVGREERTYQETMAAWRTSCPMLPVWEDAMDRGVVEGVFAEGRSTVRVTAMGLKLLKEKRPDCYERLRRQVANGSTGPVDAPSEHPAVPVKTSR